MIEAETELERASWTYLAEGNANVIFAARLQRPVLAAMPVGLNGRHVVLRVQKHGAYASAAEQLAFRQTVLYPFAKKYGINVPCLPETAVELTPALLARFEACLALVTRPSKFQNSTLGKDLKRALLLPWIRESQTMRVLEFKPKWLTWSPTATAGARFCRTCAIRAHRAGHSPRADRFCPLSLVTGSSAELGSLQAAVRSLDREQGWALEGAAQAGLVNFFKETQCFTNLARLQAEAATVDLALAMTWRDCSCFVILENDSVQNCLFADLDPKAAGKEVYWRALEQQVELEPWYFGPDSAVPCIKAAGPVALQQPI